MKYIKLGYLMFIKNFRLNFVVIFQIVALVLVGINLTSLLSIGWQAAETLRPLTERRFVYYMPPNDFLNRMLFTFEHDAQETNTDTVTEELPLTDVEFKTRIFLTDSTINDDPLQFAHIHAYDKSLLDALPLPLKNGEWFGETTKNGDVIDAVANDNSQFKTGDTVRLTVETPEDKKMTFTVRIIGTLKNPPYIPNAQHIGQALFSLSLAEDTNARKTGMPSVLLNAQDISGIEHIFLNAPENEFIVFADSITPEAYSRNINTLSAKGLVATGESIAAYDAEWARTLLRENLPMVLFLLIISLTGLISISAINMTAYMKTFSIYFICGSTKKECYKIIASYLCMMFLWAFTLSILLALICTKVHIPIFALIDFSALSCLWIGGVFAVYLLISLLVPAVVLKRLTLKEMLSKIQ